jgi:hypothetical protein
MADKWKFVSEDGETISLHDHCITSVEEIGTDLILHFTDDGFDVTKDNPLNPTGRHRNAGLAGFIMLELYAQRVLFCWNDLPRDAWFQDWPRK